MKKYSIFLFVILFQACVSTAKFNEQKAKLEAVESHNNQLISENEQLIVLNNELSGDLSRAKEALAALRADSAKFAREIADLQIERRQLNNRLHEITSTMDALRRGSERETSELMTRIDAMQIDLHNREIQLQRLSQQIADKQTDLLNMERDLENRNKRLFELERIIARQDSAALDLRNKLSAALVGLENNGLTVRMHQGKVYVSLDEQLLFSSGSITVNPAGVSALRRLARILEENTDINITIEGHTDNVPMRSSAAVQDNWDLSVKRATSIVRILLSSASISPERLTASGRGEFVPVDTENTPAARQKNRRTEIILTPKLDELFQILE